MTTLEEMAADFDAASRIKDQYDLHQIANDRGEILGKWFAFSIVDGRSDGSLYDRRYQAIAHQKGDERQYGYIEMQLTDMHVREALSILRTYRKIYEGGARVATPPNEQLVERLTFGGFGK